VQFVGEDLKSRELEAGGLEEREGGSDDGVMCHDLGLMRLLWS
jgi:hypothetical protein